MPQSQKPRQLVLRGTVEARALWFSRALLSENQVKTRVLKLWQNGAKLERFERGWLLTFAQNQKMRADCAPALPLVKWKNALVSAPFENDDAPTDGVWIVENGAFKKLENGEIFDVSLWIDAGNWELPATQTLGEIPVVETALAPLELDLRKESGVAPPDEKLTQFLQIWQRAQKDGAPFGSHARKNSRLDDFFAPFARFFTPEKSAENLPFASSLSIVLSSVLAIGGAFWFFISSFWSPKQAVEGGYLLSLAALTICVLVALFAGLRGGNGPIPSAQRAAPIVLSPVAQTVVAALVGGGLLVILARNLAAAITLGLWLVIVFWLIKILGGLATLVGNSAGAMSLAASLGARGLFGGSQNNWFSKLFGRKSQDGLIKPNPKTGDSAADAWRRLMANAAFWTGLMRVVGRKQARYVAQMMEMFERGDLENALKHAIPLGGANAENWTPPAFLGALSPRSNLDISPFQAASSGAINFGPDVDARLREIYRRAFERLRDEGKIERAAFVLAELLQNSEEAVGFLESHGKLDLAAQIAEARGLPPGLVVRQLWIAGKRERALNYARAFGAFADALVRLEKDPKRRADAVALRLFWGDFLAKSGDFASAIEAVWPIEEGKPFARKWLQNAVETGATPQILARALALAPENWEQWKSALQSLWNDDETDISSARNRQNFARVLIETAKTASNSENDALFPVAARATLRALSRDGKNELAAPEKGVWDKLLNLAGDGALRADAKTPSVSNDVSTRKEPMELRFDGARGLFPARDAVALENGEILVALGESGARLVGRDGKTRAHFDVAASKIIAPFVGNRFLLLAKRDDSWRVSQLDLSARKVKFWGDLQLVSFADQWDGARWFVGQNGRVKALDGLADGFKSLWDSGPLENPGDAALKTQFPAIGNAIQLQITLKSLAAMVPHAGGNEGFAWESWNWELPNPILRRRDTPQWELKAESGRRFLSETGEQFGVFWNKTENSDFGPLIWTRGSGDSTIEADCHCFDGAVVYHGEAMIFWRDAQNLACATCFLPQSLIVKARFRFEAQTVNARKSGDLWTLWDSAARVVVWNAQSGMVERDWRLN